VAAYHSAYRHDVSGRDGGLAQRGGAAVQRLVEGGKRREKSVFEAMGGRPGARQRPAGTGERDKLNIVKSEQWWTGPNAAPMAIAVSRCDQSMANASSLPVLTTVHASSTYVLTRAGMPTQRRVREARDTS
jgi:hypothetical protein